MRVVSSTRFGVSVMNRRPGFIRWLSIDLPGSSPEKPWSVTYLAVFTIIPPPESLLAKCGDSELQTAAPPGGSDANKPLLFKKSGQLLVPRVYANSTIGPPDLNVKLKKRFMSLLYN
jgi:hypothetical protein